MERIINATNAIIMGATIASGIFLKKWLKNAKIGKFELKRLLPIFVLIIGELLSIVYGLMTKENIVLSISNGLIISCISAFGYDVFKSFHSKGVTAEEEDKK